MPRIVGVDVPNNKVVLIALTYIHGIGRHSAGRILKEVQIDPTINAGQLTEDQVSRIAQIIGRDFIVEGQLRRQIMQNIGRLRDIACYRGIRHRRGLPVRGQQTQSNARTRKGPRRTAVKKKGGVTKK